VKLIDCTKAILISPSHQNWQRNRRSIYETHRARGGVLAAQTAHGWPTIINEIFIVSPVSGEIMTASIIAHRAANQSKCRYGAFLAVRRTRRCRCGVLAVTGVFQQEISLLSLAWKQCSTTRAINAVMFGR
jgi:hypothetical protein